MAARRTQMWKAGNVVEITAGSDISAGIPQQVGGRVGIPLADIPSGYVGNVQIRGFFKGIKVASVTGSVGDMVYWDANGAADGSGGYTTTKANGDFLVGCLVAAAAAGDTHVYFEVNAFDNDDLLEQQGNMQVDGTLTVGVNDTGYDVKLFGATAGKYLLWDESADKLILVGDADVTGAVQLTGALTVGVNNTGHDVKLFGATSGSYLLWDASADKLIIVGSADLGTACEADAYTVGGVAGADFGPGAPASITVVKGIVTACSS